MWENIRRDDKVAFFQDKIITEYDGRHSHKEGGGNTKNEVALERSERNGEGNE